MSTANEQSFKNHTRWDPVFHFFAAPVVLLTVLGSIWHAWRSHSYWNWWMVLVYVAAAVVMVRLRMYALMVQDRVIRLEERMRLNGLCSETFRPRVPELSNSQLVALRFASDAEAGALAERALTLNLTNKQIKEAIQVWRPDLNRV